METLVQKEKLRELVTKLYQECGSTVEPLYPKILIRVLPKEQKHGDIWLPDGRNQNKPTWEGLVLKVYKPFYQKIYLTDAHWVKDDPDPTVRYTQKVVCVVQPGDHILFPHIEFGQVPVQNLDGGVGEYRMIPEQIVIGKVEYLKEKTEKWVKRFFCELEGGLSESRYEYEVSELLKLADVIRKDVDSVTISGR